jgi:hypothetical protein
VVAEEVSHLYVFILKQVRREVMQLVSAVYLEDLSAEEN